MKKVLLIAGVVASLVACGGGKNGQATDSVDSTAILAQQKADSLEKAKADSLEKVKADSLALQTKREEGAVWLKDFYTKYYKAFVSAPQKAKKLRKESLTAECQKKYDKLSNSEFIDMLVPWQDPYPNANIDVKLAADGSTYDVTIKSGGAKLKFNIVLDLSGDKPLIADVKSL